MRPRIESAPEPAELSQAELKKELENFLQHEGAEDAEKLLRQMWADQLTPIPPGSKVKEEVLLDNAVDILKRIDINVDFDLRWAVDTYKKAFRERFGLGYPLHEQ